MYEWEQLKSDCLECTQCDLHQTRTQVVFGSGNPKADILFVGEGPGQREDEQGVPFVGRSGQLFDVYLETIGLNRQDDIYITNIVKCRPPENRDPSTEERNTCLPWLRAQFKIMRPKIIVCIGRVASQSLIRPDFSVMKEHGQWVHKNDIWFTGTLHPAALLRNPNNKPMVFEDYVAIREKLKEVQAPST